MNYNLITYLIYLPITSFVTIYVGLVLYKNGKHFILNLFGGDEELTNFINKILLVGYYLINLGYCFWIVTRWTEVENWTTLFNSLSLTVGVILIGLGSMHLINIGVLIYLSTKNKNQQFINQ